MNRLLALIFIITTLAFPQSAQDNNIFINGHNFERSGNLEKAKEIYIDLYNRNKNVYLYFDALNRVLLQLKEYQASADLITDKLKLNPNDINLYGMLGKTWHTAGDEIRAYDAWDKGVELAGDNPALYRVIANFAIERRAFRKAAEILRKGKEVNSADETFSYDLANIYSLLMQYEDAAKEYCSVLLMKPEQYGMVEARVMQYISKPEALQQTIKAVEDYKKNTAIKNLLGKLYIEAKDYEKAYSVYLDLEGDGEKMGSELFRFAQQVFAEGGYEYAAKAYNEIMERYPKSPFIPASKLGYAKTLEWGIIGATNNKSFRSYKVKEPEKLEEIVSAYKEIARLYSVTDVGQEANYRIGFIKFHYQDKPDEAEDYFNKCIDTSPYSPFAINSYGEIGDIYLHRGKLEDAYNSFNKLAGDGRIPEDKKRDAQYRMAQIRFYEGNFPECRNILDQLAQNFKDYSANDAIELSLMLNSSMTDSSNLVLFSQAELLGIQKKYEDAAGKYRQVYSNQGVFMVQQLAKIREAEMELAMNHTDSALVLFRKIADEKEKNIYADKALYLLGKIYQDNLSDPVKAVEIYEDLLAKFPNSLYIDDARNEILKLRNKLS